jgi:SNF2 family DNA or RNA helicase
MDFVIPGLLGPGWLFVQEHYVRDKWGAVTGYCGLEQVREKIGPYYIRRRKADVLKELPPKVYNDVPLELSKAEWKVYSAIVAQIKEAILENPKLGVGNILTMMLRLQQATNDIRLLGEETSSNSTKMDAVESLLDAAGDHQVVVFTRFAQMATLLGQYFEAPVIQGDVDIGRRRDIIAAFQRSEHPLLVSTEAGAYGVTLTAADIIVHYDFPWNPAKLRQREDRLHRIGQESSVQVVNLVARRTIDEKVRAILHRKQRLIAAVLDEEYPDEPENVSRQEVMGLLGDED